MKQIIFIIFLFLSTDIIVGDTLITTVVDVGVRGDGSMFINLAGELNEPDCKSSRVEIASNNPQLQNWFSIALAATASRSSIKIRSNKCLGAQPLLDETATSFIKIIGE